MQDEVIPTYVRRERVGRLSFSTKLFQGIGAIPDTVKNWTFNTFILLYYNQILGVDPTLVSIALAVAIVFDAITDPLVASLSDNLSTRWGRRHPLMLIGAAPLGFALYGVFVPLPGLDEMGLFVWLMAFVILTRGLMTLFFVPWAAIAAELSDDYDERTSVMAFRYAVGWTIGVSFPLFIYSFVMPGTPEYPIGQLNPEQYPTMALCAGFLLTAGALATTLLTRREIPYLRQHATTQARFSFVRSARELWRVLQNRQFALVFLIVLLSSAISGTTANIGIYMTTFFWGLTTEDLRWFALASIGALIAFPLVAATQRRWDKKHVMLVCSTISLFDGVILVSLRFFDVLPDNGNPLLLVILVGMAVFGVGIAVIQGIIGSSVIADVLDDHELRTHYRQEAMFNAALSFSGKAISSVGIIISGLILDLIDLPRGVAPADIAPGTIARLGLVVGICIPLLHLIPISLITRYKLTRRAHADIRRELDQRRANEGQSAFGVAERANGVSVPLATPKAR
jgi:Na+/melibiose symporter-like transporter